MTNYATNLEESDASYAFKMQIVSFLRQLIRDRCRKKKML